MGKYFVDLTEQLGYRKTLKAIGRNFRDLIMNLDNSHDYFKLKFPHMRAPSFFVDQEHEHGKARQEIRDDANFNGMIQVY